MGILREMARYAMEPDPPVPAWANISLLAVAVCIHLILPTGAGTLTFIWIPHPVFAVPAAGAAFSAVIAAEFAALIWCRNQETATRSGRDHARRTDPCPGG